MNQLISFVILLFFCGTTANVFSQEENQKPLSIKIEDIDGKTSYEIRDTLLLRSNGGANSKKSEKQFEQLKKCGLDFSLASYSLDSLPEEIFAFGHMFYLREEDEYSKSYVSAESDSEVHSMEFIYNRFLSAGELERVNITSLNVRSGEEYPRYTYRFSRLR